MHCVPRPAPPLEHTHTELHELLSPEGLRLCDSAERAQTKRASRTLTPVHAGREVHDLRHADRRRDGRLGGARGHGARAPPEQS